MIHRPIEELEAALEAIRDSPKDVGTIELIVRRPAVEEREVLEEAVLDLQEGLQGDNWRHLPCSRSDDGNAHPDMQLTVMNARVIALLAVEQERWPLAGDQLYVDFDLSTDNLPLGARLALGTAVIEITDQPHRGCAKFKDRFGAAALKFVNSPLGVELNLRGVNAKVVEPGTIRLGDKVTKLAAP